MSLWDWSVRARENVAQRLSGFALEDLLPVRNQPAVIRDLMANVANYVSDQGGALVTEGARNAYVIKTGTGLRELRAGISLTIRADRDNTAEATLNVDGLGPLPWVDAAGIRLQPGRILKDRFYSVFLDPEAPAWRVQAGASTLDEIPGLIDLRADVSGKATVVAQKASEAQQSASRASDFASQSEADRSEVAANRGIVEAARSSALASRLIAEDRAAVAQSQAEIATAQSLQAQNAVATGRVLKDTFADVGGVVGSGLASSLSYPEGAQGEVLLGSGAGLYVKSGSSGSGSWVKKSGATVPALDERAKSLEGNFRDRRRGDGLAVTDEAGYLVLEANRRGFRAPGLTTRLRRGGKGVGITDDQGNGLLSANGKEFSTPTLKARRRTRGKGTAITDEAGNLIVGADPRGFRAPGLTARLRRSGEGLAITDEAGAALIHVTKRDLKHPEIQRLKRQLQRASLGLSQAEGAPWPSAIALAECLQIALYGQSLSIGWLSQPVVSNLPLPYADRFVGGVRASDGGADAAVTHASLVGLFEQAGGNAYESPASAMAQMIAQLLRDENGIDITSAGPRLLLSTPGESGQSLAALSSGALLQRLYDDIDYGQIRSAAAGRTANLGALGWTQGESDYLENTDPAVWATGVRNLRAMAETRANTTGGLSRTLPMFLTQTATHLNYGRATPGIALQQLALCDEAPFGFVTPMHFLRYVADRVHLENLSSMHLGAFYGLAIKRAAIDGVKIKPLVPDQAQRNGPCAILNFASAQGGLVFDTATCPNPGNYGFTLAAPDGSAIPVASVKLIGPNTVAVRAGSTLPAGAKVRNAWIGDGDRGLGNLRDRQGESLNFDPTGLRLPMHRFAPIFERTLS